MSDALIVSLDEFAELCGVSSVTMRTHLRDLGRDGGDLPAWLIERGDRGRNYKIDAEGGVRWWQARRDAEDQGNAERAQRMQQLRLDTIGDAADEPEALALSGKQRREEYAAAQEAIKYRKLMGQLVEKAPLQRVLTNATVELRKQLQRVAPEAAIKLGLSADQARDLDGIIERAVAQFVATIEKPHAFED
ncbi:hypothetical protein CA234_03030 [Sphingomonas sp. ABOLE]|uniref:hypothetical protein n=1 Tax=Sphingomonas sp. ABOLE TaxID=1985878 RepID=UPI001004502A|nr:hypothetical protein [Sphingomonas sp. ABOLE]RSV44403.1 hypothetical protein CA234_03030 [Sphingomonas sp. ABOLE]